MPKAKKTPPKVTVRKTVGTKATTGMPDRIHLDFGLTINMGNYESSRVDVGMATDLRFMETHEAALARCEAVIEPAIRKQVNQIKGFSDAPQSDARQSTGKSKSGKRSY